MEGTAVVRSRKWALNKATTMGSVSFGAPAKSRRHVQPGWVVHTN